MMLLVYAVIKLLTYTVWCSVLVLLRKTNPTLRSAMTFGVMRWLIGIGAGVAVFLFVGSVERESLPALYFGIYLPLRIVEWSFMAWWITRSAPASTTQSRFVVLAWCVSGILLSFATDLMSPDGIQGRFCTGRCLC